MRILLIFLFLTIFQKVIPFFAQNSAAQNRDFRSSDIVGLWERCFVESPDSLCTGCQMEKYQMCLTKFEFNADGTMIYSGVRTLESDSAAFAGKWSFANGTLITEIEYGYGPYCTSHTIR